MTRSFYKYIFIVLIAVFVFLFWKSERKEIIPQYSDDLFCLKRLDGDSYQIDLITSVLKPYKNDLKRLKVFPDFLPIKKRIRRILLLPEFFIQKIKVRQ